MAKDPQANLFEGKNDIQNRKKTLVILSKAKVQELKTGDPKRSQFSFLFSIW